MQETGENKVGDDVRGEFVAMVNYAVMALIQGTPLSQPQAAASSPNLGEQFGWRATFDVPTSGTYIVKIGDHPAKKIMVIR